MRRRAVAPAHGADGAHRAQERVEIVGHDPVFDLDQHRAVVGLGLVGYGTFKTAQAFFLTTGWGLWIVMAATPTTSRSAVGTIWWR